MTEEMEEEVTVHGEVVVVSSKVPVCPVCKQPIGTPDSIDQTLGSAYKAYRERHGLLSPDEIREIRLELGLGAEACNRLFGWEPGTMRRYESGGVLTPEHDRILREIAGNPAVVHRYMELPECRMLPGERKLLAESAGGDLAAWDLLFDCGLREDGWRAEEPGERTGWLRPDPVRLAAMMAWVARQAGGTVDGGTFVPALLMADLLHFFAEGVGISGFTYKVRPPGPVPWPLHDLIWWAVVNGLLEYEGGDEIFDVGWDFGLWLGKSHVQVLERAWKEVGHAQRLADELRRLPVGETISYLKAARILQESLDF